MNKYDLTKEKIHELECRKAIGDVAAKIKELNIPYENVNDFFSEVRLILLCDVKTSEATEEMLKILTELNGRHVWDTCICEPEPTETYSEEGI